MTWSSHPDALVLSNWIDGFLPVTEAAAVAQHVAGCSTCRVAAADGLVPVTAQSTEFGVSQLVLDAFASLPPDPEPGQLWQVAWAGSGDLALIVDVSGPTVTAVPAEPDVHLADDQTVLVDAASRVAPLARAFWVGLRHELPQRVLHTCFGSVDDDALERVMAMLDGTETPTSPPITSVLDERSQLRDAIASRFDQLSAATWLQPRSTALNLEERARALGIRPKRVAEALGVAPGVATAILRQRQSIPPDALPAAAALFGLSVEELAGTAMAFEPGLIDALDRPCFRNRLLRGANTAGMSEAGYRLDAATRLAARRFRSQSADGVDWDEVVEEFLVES
jgi:hypothetical protein